MGEDKIVSHNLSNGGWKKDHAKENLSGEEAAALLAVMDITAEDRSEF